MEKNHKKNFRLIKSMKESQETPVPVSLKYLPSVLVALKT